jgi:hypothetical protein
MAAYRESPALPGYGHCCGCSPRPLLIPALPFCHAELRAPKPKPSHYPKLLNTLGDHIRSCRLDLGLFQSTVAEHSALTQPPSTIGKATSPSLQSDTCLPSSGFWDITLFQRQKHFLSGSRLSERCWGCPNVVWAGSLGVDPGTLQSWEAGQHEPAGRNVELVARFLTSAFESNFSGNFLHGSDHPHRSGS